MMNYDELIRAMIQAAFKDADSTISKLPAVVKTSDDLDEWLRKNTPDDDAVREAWDKILDFEYLYSYACFSAGFNLGMQIQRPHYDPVLTDTEEDESHE